MGVAESYFDLDNENRRQLLLTAAGQLGRDPALLEKDIWVVWLLRWLYASPWREHLVFKGGTSLSKVFGLIDRFSEDIDLTYDIRELLPDLADQGADPLPVSRAQADRWSRQARDALAQWVEQQVQPALAEATQAVGAGVRCAADVLFVTYPATFAHDGLYMSPEIKLEFGGRATGAPIQQAAVICDAAAVPALAALLPHAPQVQVMQAARTFWEKATAAHVYCLQQVLPAERFARHWFDLACMERAGIVASALADTHLAVTVAAHKQMFFRAKADDTSVIDYHQAVTGHLQLVPDAAAAARLHMDYDAMRSGGFLGSWQPSFDEVLAICARIEEQANAAP